MKLCTSKSIVLFALSNSPRISHPHTLKIRNVAEVLSMDVSMSLCSSSAPKCEPCSGLDETAKMSIEEANTELSSLGSASSIWSLKESHDGVLSLSRKFIAKNFQAALDAINDVGTIAENENHHPNLHLTNYREVEIEIYTHKLKGLTRNDFILAGKITSDVLIDYSPKWLRENPSAVPTSKGNKESK